MKPASWNLWVDGGFLVLRLAKRGAASWQDGGEQSNWQLPAKRLKDGRLFRGREPSRRAGYRGRRCCWPIARILRSVRWGKELGFIIKRFSALRGAGAGLWAAGGDRGSATAGQRTSHHAGGQSLVGVAGVRQGAGARVCA